MPDRWQSLYANNGMLESLEPYLAKWEHTKDLNDRALQMGRYVKQHSLRACPTASICARCSTTRSCSRRPASTEPPKTLDEFVEAAKKVSALPGKYGYCLRGGPGGLNGWMMFGATANGDQHLLQGGRHLDLADPGWVKGVTFLTDLYKNGYAPKDAVNWGFNEIVSGFYSGTCAMLDQDPDALIAVAERMNKDDYDIAPMPEGRRRQGLPDARLRRPGRCSPTTKDKDLAWKLIATLVGPEGNVAWNKKIGALPIYKAAEKDPFYADPKFKGWFEELADPNVIPTVMPTYLEEFAFFAEFDRGEDDPAGPARPAHARGHGQAMGRLPDRGPAEVPGEEQVTDAPAREAEAISRHRTPSRRPGDGRDPVSSSKSWTPSRIATSGRAKHDLERGSDPHACYRVGRHRSMA